MKTLLIIDHLKQGGAQRIVTGVLKNLPSTKIIPLRVNNKNYSGIEWGITEDQYFFKPGANNSEHIRSLFKIAGLIRQEKIDIIHFHLPGSWVFSIFLRLILPSKYRPIFLYTEHSSRLLKSWFYPILIRFYSMLGYLIPESEYVMNILIANGASPNKTLLLRNFIDLDTFSPGPRKQLLQNKRFTEFNDQTKVVGFAGRLTHYKGWDHFLDIAEKLRNENILFLIAGDGVEREKVVSEIISRNLGEKVYLLGYLNSMAEFYNSLDLYLALSAQESFGLTIMEAQACGIPVIAYDSPFSMELGAGKTFLTVKRNSIEMISTAVVQLLENQQQREIFIAAGLENAKQFGFDNYLNNLKTIYTSILEREGRAF